MTAAVDAPRPRRIVFHADDFGMSPQVNQGILRGFAEGLLTSTSILTNAPHVSPAVAAWKRLVEAHSGSQLPSFERRRQLGDSARSFDLGIHLNLSQGRPLTSGQYPDELLDDAGRFPGILGVFRFLRRPGTRYRAAVSAELSRQIEVMFDHGLPPTHVNGHQYVEMIPGVAETLPELLSKYRIPVVRVAIERGLFRSTLLHGFHLFRWSLGCVKQAYARGFRAKIAGLGLPFPDAYCGTAHAGRIDLTLMRLFLDDSKRSRVTEICVHPGDSWSSDEPPQNHPDDGWGDALASLRPGELKLLRSSQLDDLLSTYSLQLGRLSDLGNSK